MSDEVIVMVKFMNGDLIIGQHVGYDQSDSLLIQDPLVVTATAGYLLLTDYCPFLTAQDPHPVMHFNPMSPIYIEEVGKDMVHYYHTCVKYRDMIKGDLDRIIMKSQSLIDKTMASLRIDQKTELNTLEDLLAQEFGPVGDAMTSSDSGDESKPPVDGMPEEPKVVDFKAILEEAMRKKKDPLN